MTLLHDVARKNRDRDGLDRSSLPGRLHDLISLCVVDFVHVLVDVFLLDLFLDDAFLVLLHALFHLVLILQFIDIVITVFRDFLAILSANVLCASWKRLGHLLLVGKLIYEVDFREIGS